MLLVHGVDLSLNLAWVAQPGSLAFGPGSSLTFPPTTRPKASEKHENTWFWDIKGKIGITTLSNTKNRVLLILNTEKQTFSGPRAGLGLGLGFRGRALQTQPDPVNAHVYLSPLTYVAVRRIHSVF